MTSKIAQLRQAALDVRVGIFRSLPLRVRLAHAFKVLANSTGRAFDEAVKRILLKAGSPNANAVRGMGDRIFKTMLSKYRAKSSDFVEEAMMDFIFDLVESSRSVATKLDPSRSVDAIRSYLTTAVDAKIRAKMRMERSRPQITEESLFDDVTHEKSTLDIERYLEDPAAAQQFEDLFDASELRRLKNNLDRVVPWGGAYLDMLLDGYSDKEIIGDKDRGLPSMLARKLHDQEYLLTPSGVPMSMASWSKVNGWKDKLFTVVKEHMEDAAENDY